MGAGQSHPYFREVGFVYHGIIAVPLDVWDFVILVTIYTQRVAPPGLQPPMLLRSIQSANLRQRTCHHRAMSSASLCSDHASSEIPRKAFEFRRSERRPLRLKPVALSMHYILQHPATTLADYSNNIEGIGGTDKLFCISRLLLHTLIYFIWMSIWN